MSKTFEVVTLGCKVNQYESAFLEESFSGAGWHGAARGKSADVIVVNTCIVTQKAAHQSRQALRKAIRENPESLVAAIGCYAQVFPEEIEIIDGLGLMVNNRAKAELPRLLMEQTSSDKKNRVLPPFEPEDAFEFLDIKNFPGRTRAYLKIQDGCRSFCSYCIVPYARGPYRSLAPRKILGALEGFSNRGYREVVLTGIHLGKYGVDLPGGMDLKTLLRMVGKEKLPLRIRLSSLEPRELETEIIEMAASEKWFCPHFHIPLQSGDDRVLKKMNRGYTTKEFAEKIETVHAAVPQGAIGVDVMAGFPGEDAPAQANCLSLLADLPISYLHVFPFSPRKGTPAWTLKDRVDPQTIKARARQLRTLGREKRLSFHKGCLGLTFEVLTEREDKETGRMLGTSENYLPFVFPRDDRFQGHMVRMRAKQISDGRILGEILS